LTDRKAARRRGRRWFQRPVVEVAHDLVGAELRGRVDGTRVRLRLVEVEAYLGVGEDPASHAHRGVTPRNRNMFETPGHLYVYVSYGLHHCLNVVCEPPGAAGAILLRAAEPLAGHDALVARRGRSGVELTNGPGKLGQALGADLSWDGLDLVNDPRLGLWPGAPPAEIAASGRIGIRLAAERPLRFFDPHSVWVSKARPAPAGRRTTTVWRRPTPSTSRESCQ